MRFPSIALISALLLSVGLLTPAQAFTYTADESPTTADQRNPKSSTDLAYIDLTLTTTDSYGGEITVDEAFSLYFRSDATDGWDPYDASQLLPRGDTWAIMAFKGEKNGEEVLKSQESRPYADSIQVVDVEFVQKNMPAATYTITVDRWYSVPSNWSLRLKSQALDTTFVIDEKSDVIEFEMEASTSSKSNAGPKATTDTTMVSMAGEVGPKSSTLPVELSSFTARLNGEKTSLNWTTASETNNSGFAIQHRQAESHGDKSQWTQLGFVEGEGTTDQPQQYRFTTSSLPSGTHHFRLKQIDHDGTVHLSEARTVVRRVKGTMELTTAPNPFTTQLTISVTARKRQTAQVRLMDMLGRVVKETGPIQLQANTEAQTQIDGRRLASGSYILQVEGETFTTTERVMHVR